MPGVSRDSSHGPSLGLEKATNARDLGGYPTRDGRIIHHGRLFRANALNRLSDADVATLGKLGLACVIDFRHQREIELIGADKLPSPSPRVVPMPVFDPDHDVFTAVSAVLRGKAGEEALVHLREDAQSGGAATMMIELYQRFVHSEEIRRIYAAAMRLVADAGELPLLFHCTAGKDRTGWLAVLVLSAVGVDRDTIMVDYLRTTELNSGGRDYMMSTMSARVAEPSIILPLLEAREEYLLASFDEAERLFGGMDGYLRDGLGLSEAELATIRSNLLD